LSIDIGSTPATHHPYLVRQNTRSPLNQFLNHTGKRYIGWLKLLSEPIRLGLWVEALAVLNWHWQCKVVCIRSPPSKSE